nr:3-oxoacyl-ACP reductase [Oceanococcus sp. HetDA_MAG_MS8]
MSDYLVKLAENPTVRTLFKNVGLPTPPKLARANSAYADEPLSGKTVLMGSAAKGYAAKSALPLIKAMGATVDQSTPATLTEGQSFDRLVFDATGFAEAADIRALYDFFHPVIRRLKNNGRVVLMAALPEAQDTVAGRTVARAVEGFSRSLAKEIGKKGSTVNLLYVEKGAEKRLKGPLRFFLSDHSTYVDGQAVRVSTVAKAPTKVPTSAVLEGKVALVTGGARGIGAATAQRLAAEGAHVVVLDIPQDAETLNATAQKINGTALAMDITDPATPGKLVDYFKSNHGGVDIVVHNAGVTRDKTIANMKPQFWDMVQNINLAAILAVDEALLAADAIKTHGRIVCLSSIGGIAGNMGQTNYGATKAGLIGYVAGRSTEVASKGICINAVAPGFIETRMTAAMPFAIREAGRRLCSLSQGGDPKDVAELITFLSTPGAAGISGQVIRVCGQSLVGA